MATRTHEQISGAMQVLDDFRREDCYYADDDLLHELDVLVEFPESQPLPDSFYQDWEAEIANTFGGMYIDDEVKSRLFAVLYGRGGYFMLSGAAEANGLGHPGIARDLAYNSKNRLLRQRDQIMAILGGSFDEANVPLGERVVMVDAVIDAIAAKYSGDQNKTVRAKEKVRLGIGKTAAKKAS